MPKYLFIGGPRHGTTLDVRTGSYTVPHTYNQERLSICGRERVVYVCQSDLSTQTAESYIADLLTRCFDAEIAKRGVI